MIRYIKDFRTSEQGAITVDWVVLSAAIVTLAASVSLLILGDGTTDGMMSLVEGRIAAVLSALAGTG